jgi:hypothetical protein
MGMPAEFRDLLLRFAQLGRLLPPKPEDEDDVTAWHNKLRDPHERAAVQVVLDEMKRVRAEIDAYLDAHGERRVNSVPR